MGEVVSQRTFESRTVQRTMSPHMGWRGCDVSIIISVVGELKLDNLTCRQSKSDFENISAAKETRT